MKVETHISDKEIVERLEIDQFDGIASYGWGISLQAIQKNGKTVYRPDVMLYMYKTSSPEQMVPTIMFTEKVYASKTDAILHTYFAGIKIFGIKLVPDILVYGTDKTEETINLVDILMENEDAADFYSESNAMIEKKHATVH